MKKHKTFGLLGSFISSKERVGLFLIAFIFSTFIIIEFILRAEHTTYSSDFSILEKHSQNSIATKNELKLFIFNPNELCNDSILLLNIPLHVKKNIIKYRNAGGFFYSKADLKKIYGITDSVYTVISSYISLPLKDNDNTKKNKYYSSNSKLEFNKNLNKELHYPININLCTKDELKELQGIGEYRAEKIINFRNLLGGFSHKNLLFRTYNIPDTIINSILSYIEIDTAGIIKINLNTCTISDLYKHPLISRKQAQKIINYRNIVDTIIDKKELLQNKILSKEECDTLLYYFNTKK